MQVSLAPDLMVLFCFMCQPPLSFSCFHCPLNGTTGEKLQGKTKIRDASTIWKSTFLSFCSLIRTCRPCCQRTPLGELEDVPEAQQHRMHTRQLAGRYKNTSKESKTVQSSSTHHSRELCKPGLHVLLETNERTLVAHLVAVVWSAEHRDAFAIVLHQVAFVLDFVRAHKQFCNEEESVSKSPYGRVYHAQQRESPYRGHCTPRTTL